jgi:hypothetical protein
VGARSQGVGARGDTHRNRGRDDGGRRRSLAARRAGAL